MTIVINNNKISKTTFELAYNLADKSGLNVVIFEADMGKEKKNFIATVPEFEGSPNKENLTKIATVNANGDFVD